MFICIEDRVFYGYKDDMDFLFVNIVFNIIDFLLFY